MSTFLLCHPPPTRSQLATRSTAVIPRGHRACLFRPAHVDGLNCSSRFCGGTFRGLGTVELVAPTSRACPERSEQKNLDPHIAGCAYVAVYVCDRGGRPVTSRARGSLRQ